MLLKELRTRLASGTNVHGIVVTRPLENIPLQDRFVQVRLENSGGDVITVIINTENVCVVGYLVGSTLRLTLHFLDDVPQELLQAFPSTDYTHSRLGFTGNYGSLSDRDRTELGHGALNDAIRNLYYGDSLPSTLLVIIQTVAEAVRIRYIEHLILRNMYGQNQNFIPENRAISLENTWLDLSQQIQWSAVPEATKWFLYNAGTIMNPRSDLVITAGSSTQGTELTVTEDNNSSRQAWSAGNYTQPTITYISGFREMCLQANGANVRVWLANCVIGTEPRQQ
nr:ribosome-inactivating protein [Tanacetum cinerariifolium]